MPAGWVEKKKEGTEKGLSPTRKKQGKDVDRTFTRPQTQDERTKKKG